MIPADIRTIEQGTIWEATQAAYREGREVVGLVPCWYRQYDNTMDLDSIRCEAMRALLNDEGRRYLGMYDAGCSPRQMYREALDHQDYDNPKSAGDALKAGKPYAFIGSGICDHYFTTPAELLMLCRWVCLDGYLSCYRRDGLEARTR